METKNKHSGSSLDSMFKELGEYNEIKKLVEKKKRDESNRINKIRKFWKNIPEDKLNEHRKKCSNYGKDNPSTKNEITLINEKTNEIKTMLRTHWRSKMKVSIFALLKGDIKTSKGWKLHKDVYEDY